MTDRGQATVAGILVAYETDPATLAATLARLAPQLDRIYVVDNSQSPTPLESVVREASDGGARFLHMGGNRGIAAAQNAGLRLAADDGAEFVLMLDDDSTLPSSGVADLVSEFRDHFAADARLVGMGPRVVDERTGQPVAARWSGNRIVPGSGPGSIEAAYLVSSGALLRTDSFSTYGAFREDYFIDHVDKEWGLRVGKRGGRFIVTDKVTMQHRLGDEPTESKKGSLRYRHDSPTRNYYLTRNAIFVMRDVRLSLSKTFHLATFLIRNSGRKLMDRSLDREVRVAVFKGFVDGLANRRGPFEQARRQASSSSPGHAPVAD